MLRHLLQWSLSEKAGWIGFQGVDPKEQRAITSKGAAHAARCLLPCAAPFKQY